MDRLKTAVLISGRGSNMEALIEASAPDDFPAQIVAVISNNPDAKGLEKARKSGIATYVVDHRDFSDKESFDRALDEKIRSTGAEFVCLAGFMRLLTPAFVTAWNDRLINIHPSLLPAFKGLQVHERVLESGVLFSGCTVHFVRPEMDAGPIITQAAVAVAANDTPIALASRVLEAEHRCYPLALRLIAEGRVKVSGESVSIEGATAPDCFLTNPVESEPPN